MANKKRPPANNLGEWSEIIATQHKNAKGGVCEVNDGCKNKGVAWLNNVWLCPGHMLREIKKNQGRTEPLGTRKVNRPKTTREANMAADCLTLALDIMRRLCDVDETNALMMIQYAVNERHAVRGFTQAREMYMPEQADKIAKQAADADQETAWYLTEQYLLSTK